MSNVVIMKGILISILLILTTLSCTESEPSCIDERIMQFQESQGKCLGATVQKFRFQGQILYGFTDGQCISDGGTSLVDEDCNNFCFIGGIAALTECDGIPFAQNSELLETLWIYEE